MSNHRENQSKSLRVDRLEIVCRVFRVVDDYRLGPLRYTMYKIVPNQKGACFLRLTQEFFSTISNDFLEPRRENSSTACTEKIWIGTTRLSKYSLLGQEQEFTILPMTPPRCENTSLLVPYDNGKIKISMLNEFLWCSQWDYQHSIIYSN